MTVDARERISDTVASVDLVREDWSVKGRALHERLTKPAGSLGVLESVGADLCAIQRCVRPRVDRLKVLVFAADHGITKNHAVGPYPREVTAQMVRNFVAGGAAINVFAEVAGAELGVVDVGVDADFAEAELDASGIFLSCPVARGTADITSAPAMTRGQALQAFVTGIELADQCAEAGIQAAALGEMGIGNTTIASAMTSAMLGLPAADVTGPGTGADEQTVARKTALIAKALSLHDVDPSDGLEVLQKLGGFELAGLAGLSTGLARHRIAVVADGFISTAAVLAAVRICPAVAGYVFSGHRSPEPGHARLLEALDKEPLLDLGLRLGEGTGACLSLTLLKAAARAMSDMATFAEAGVKDK